MASTVPLITTDRLSLALTGRDPASGDPPAGVPFRLSVYVRVRDARVNVNPEADVVWLVFKDATARVIGTARVVLERDGVAGGWLHQHARCAFPTTFRPSRDAVKVETYAGEWQTGIAGAFGRNVSASQILLEAEKGAASELWLGGTATMRLPADVAGPDDFYGDPDTRGPLARLVSGIGNTAVLMGLAFAGAYAFNVSRPDAHR